MSNGNSTTSHGAQPEITDSMLSYDFDMSLAASAAASQQTVQQQHPTMPPPQSIIEKKQPQRSSSEVLSILAGTSGSLSASSATAQQPQPSSSNSITPSHSVAPTIEDSIDYGADIGPSNNSTHSRPIAPTSQQRKGTHDSASSTLSQVFLTVESTVNESVVAESQNAQADVKVRGSSVVHETQSADAEVPSTLPGEADITTSADITVRVTRENGGVGSNAEAEGENYSAIEITDDNQRQQEQQPSQQGQQQPEKDDKSMKETSSHSYQHEQNNSVISIDGSDDDAGGNEAGDQACVLHLTMESMAPTQTQTQANVLRLDYEFTQQHDFMFDEDDNHRLSTDEDNATVFRKPQDRVPDKPTVAQVSAADVIAATPQPSVKFKETIVIQETPAPAPAPGQLESPESGGLRLRFDASFNDEEDEEETIIGDAPPRSQPRQQQPQQQPEEDDDIAMSEPINAKSGEFRLHLSQSQMNNSLMMTQAEESPFVFCPPDAKTTTVTTPYTPPTPRNQHRPKTVNSYMEANSTTAAPNMEESNRADDVVADIGIVGPSDGEESDSNGDSPMLRPRHIAVPGSSGWKQRAGGAGDRDGIATTEVFVFAESPHNNTKASPIRSAKKKKKKLIKNSDKKQKHRRRSCGGSSSSSDFESSPERYTNKNKGNVEEEEEYQFESTVCNTPKTPKTPRRQLVRRTPTSAGSNGGSGKKKSESRIFAELTQAAAKSRGPVSPSLSTRHKRRHSGGYKDYDDDGDDIMMDDANSPRKCPVVKKGRTIKYKPQFFEDMNFLITLSEQKMDKKKADQLKETLAVTIVKYGGTVIGQLDYSFEPGVSLAVQKIVLISNTPQRTPKYMLALAIGALPISYEWIHKCDIEEALVPCQKYILDAGTSSFTGKSIKLPVPHEDVDFYIKDVDERVFFDRLVMVEGTPAHKESWSYILHQSGAEIVTELLPKKKLMLPENKDYRAPEVIVCDVPPSEEIRVEAERQGIPIVNREWAMQCLINQKIVDADPFEDFPSITHHNSDSDSSQKDATISKTKVKSSGTPKAASSSSSSKLSSSAEDSSDSDKTQKKGSGTIKKTSAASNRHITRGPTTTKKQTETGSKKSNHHHHEVEDNEESEEQQEEIQDSSDNTRPNKPFKKEKAPDRSNKKQPSTSKQEAERSDSNTNKEKETNKEKSSNKEATTTTTTTTTAQKPVRKSICPPLVRLPIVWGEPLHHPTSATNSSRREQEYYSSFIRGSEEHFRIGDTALFAINCSGANSGEETYVGRIEEMWQDRQGNKWMTIRRYYYATDLDYADDTKDDVNSDNNNLVFDEDDREREVILSKIQTTESLNDNDCRIISKVVLVSPARYLEFKKKTPIMYYCKKLTTMEEDAAALGISSSSNNNNNNYDDDDDDTLKQQQKQEKPNEALQQQQQQQQQQLLPPTPTTAVAELQLIDFVWNNAPIEKKYDRIEYSSCITHGQCFSVGDNVRVSADMLTEKQVAQLTAKKAAFHQSSSSSSNDSNRSSVFFVGRIKGMFELIAEDDDDDDDGGSDGNRKAIFVKWYARAATTATISSVAGYELVEADHVGTTITIAGGGKKVPMTMMDKVYVLPSAAEFERLCNAKVIQIPQQPDCSNSGTAPPKFFYLATSCNN